MSDKIEFSDKALRKIALDLYEPPFTYDPLGQFILDSKRTSIVCDQDNITRIRGWGHIQKMENPEKIQDKLGEMIAEALNEYWLNNT